jgi:HPt (histidine-containing phosphotransfer) domain-containing protein
MTFDSAALLDRFGGDRAFVLECADVLKDEVPEMFAAMRAAADQNSSDQLFRAAHTMKGALSNFCEDGPTKTAARLDALAREGRIDQAVPLIPILEGEVAALVAALGALRSEGA